MRPIPETIDKPWPMIKECWLACMTCLFDDDFWLTWYRASTKFLSCLLIFLVKLVVTILWPLSGLLLAPLMLWDSKRSKKLREKAEQRTRDAMFGNTQRL